MGKVGKQKKGEVKKNCAFMAEPSLIDELDVYAEKMGLTRSQLLRNIVSATVDEFKIMDRTGVLKSVITVRDLFTVRAKNHELRGGEETV